MVAFLYGVPKNFKFLGRRRERGAICVVAKSNSPSGASLDAGKAMQEKNFSNTFGERLLKIFFDRVGRETKSSKLG